MNRRAKELLLAALVLTLVPARVLIACGVERWSVKTGSDPDAGLVNLSSSTAQTIATMRSWTAPNPIPTNSRVAPYETTQWTLNATLVEYKAETDEDYHLVIQDAAGNTMIAEIPSPGCVAAGSPFTAGIQNARSEFDAVYSATSSFQTVNVPVQIKGVGMFDFLHGQTGVAPNGIEIHPVLDIVFNPGSPAPDFSLAVSPTSLSAAQGSAASATVTTGISGSFSSAVSLTASGLPAGVTASFSPSTIAAPGSGTSTLTLSASASAAAGTYTITVTGSGGGVTHAASLAFTVTTAGGGGGGTVPVNGNFETGSLSPWTATGVSSILSSGAHGGTYAAQLGSTSPSTDSTLAQTFTLPSNASTLSFYVKITCPDTLTYDWVTATLKDNSTAATTTVLAKTCSNTGAWQNVSTSVSASAGHSVTLTFANHDDNYSGDATYSAWDDVTIGTASATYSISGSAGTSGANVTVGAAGSATSDASNNYTIGNLAAGSYTVTPSKSGCTFTPASQAVSITTASVSGVNFTASCGGGATTLLTDGFEAAGWATTQVSGTGGAWAIVTSSSYPSISAHGGTHWADFNSYTSSSGSQTRLYRTATLAIPSSYTTVTLKFWMYHDTGYSTYADKVQAQVGVGSTWTNVGSAVNRYNGTTGWAQVSVDISAYKGQTISLGFLGISAYGNDEYLDDVTVVAQ